MNASVQVHSLDAASGTNRTITLVKTGADTLSAIYESSAEPGNQQHFNPTAVSADPTQGRLKVSYRHFPLFITATGHVVKEPPSVSASVGMLGDHQFPLQPGEGQKVIDFLKDTHFPMLA